MNADQATFVLDYLQGSFPGTVADEEHVVVWLEELGKLDQERAIATVRRLRGKVDFLPTHKRFAEEYAKTPATSSRELTSGSGPCRECDGSGWRTVEVVSGAEAMARCACSAPPPDSGHQASCTCRVCHYGAARAARINEGTDVMVGPRRGTDPLRARPAETYQPGQF